MRCRFRNVECPVSGSLPSGFLCKMLGQLAVGLAAMGELVLLFRGELGKRLLRVARQKPGVPAEMAFAARMDEHFAGSLADEEVGLRSVPVADAALRFRGAIVERVGDGGEPLAAGGFEQPLHVRTGKVS